MRTYAYGEELAEKPSANGETVLFPRFEGIDLEFKDLMKSVSYCPTVVTFCSEV